MPIQTEKDKVAAVLDVAINGDGGASTAATNYNLSDAGRERQYSATLTLKAWLNFKLQFENPYALMAAFANSAVALQLYTAERWLRERAAGLDPGGERFRWPDPDQP